MRVSTGTIVVSFMASMFLGGGVSLLVHFNSSAMDNHLRLAAGLSLVIGFISIIGIFAHYQQSLQLAKRNLDEAQEQALLGSWERNLVTGKGYWSDNRYRLFGMKPAKTAPGLDDFYELIHTDDREQVRQTVSAAVRDSKDYETSYRLANDIHNRIFLSRGRIVFDASGKPVKVAGTTQDITEKCRQEDFLRDLVRQKSLFITRLGHDLRTPLTPLVALLPLIRDNAANEKQRHLTEICIANTGIIRDLVSKAVDLSRYSSANGDSLHLENMELVSYVDDFLASMGNMIKAHSFNVVNDVGHQIHVYAGRKELTELFSNIISNAIKFSPDGSDIRIEAHHENDQIYISVKDSGIGLSPEEKSRIFDEFYKADSSRHELGSSGLGLAICRQIVENLGGRIWAESDGKGLGTSICFTLNAGGTA